MCQALKKYLLCIFCCVALNGYAVPAMAQDTANKDTVTYAETTETSTALNGEYIPPEVPVARNVSSPTAGQWQKVTSDPPYNYRNRQEVLQKEETPPKDQGLISFILSLFNFFRSALGRMLLWGALILIVGYVIYRIVSGQGNRLFAEKDRNTEDKVAITEEGLMDADWEGEMRSALQAGDARAGIRFGYLRLLQLLQQRGHIIFRPDKTNTDYYRELADKPQRQTFRDMARQYEWTWYGNFLPDKAGLDSYLQSFQQLKQSLGAA